MEVTAVLTLRPELGCNCVGQALLSRRSRVEGRVEEDVAKNLAVFVTKARAPGKKSKELS